LSQRVGRLGMQSLGERLTSVAPLAIVVAARLPSIVIGHV
jgi:hypothetical protein